MTRPRLRWTAHRRLVAPLLRAALPTPCAVCLIPLGTRQLHGVCLGCWSRIRPIGGHPCPGCGAPGTEASPPVPCGGCLLAPPLFDACRAATVYGGAARAILLRAKLGGRHEILRVLGWQLALSLRIAALDEGCDVVVPVPSHPLTRVVRGFDPAREIGRPVAGMLGLPLDPKALRRRIGARSSAKRLRAAARRRTLAGAFVAHPKRVAGCRVLLVDDVLTTGATASAATAALRGAGAAGVRLAVWGRVPPP